MTFELHNKIIYCKNRYYNKIFYHKIDIKKFIPLKADIIKFYTTIANIVIKTYSKNRCYNKTFYHKNRYNEILNHKNRYKIL